MSGPLHGALLAGLRELNLELEPRQQEQLLAYLALLQQWNRVYNLTAVRDPGEMLSHHLLDSLAAVAPLRTKLQGRGSAAGLRLLDVGSGGGLPGVVFAICLPELEVTCVDAVAKKAAFIRQAAGALKLPNLHALHGRVEALEGRFDVVCSRAFASLADFAALSRHLLATGSGVWLAMKGKHPQDEIDALPAQVGVFHVEPLQVPQLQAQRCLVWMRTAP
ncbi:16S rRNA (guanine(527)-N(7))-methyltransferase RsmG [Comamonas sp. NLF-1-9]|uniref:16S rRNA (guanine(527)-N(7))-methyltransferase RsmG n=1 Tax=Comamonas sp. NLF-1-9 TaxID=2853163 RepID=UPI001C44EA97|nr:16S rRNA (guanine(527)-N(7))-methyltransferase RsmG [Comamonas sp. NLF-1-9]QXL83865.1 16S rRNA (guanine(527)-N(7))-methyltransferase RsmG [Comamonas sp. NLF-1-9]